jgi:hypothetical protein
MGLYDLSLGYVSAVRQPWLQQFIADNPARPLRQNDREFSPLLSLATAFCVRSLIAFFPSPRQLIASWVNFLLVAFEIQQLARYFKRFSSSLASFNASPRVN